MTRWPLLALVACLALPAAAQINGPAACTNGTATLAGVAYPCRGVDVMSLVPTGVDGPLRTTAMNDIWGWTDPTTGREYALGGTRSGTVFVDVTNPAQPLVLGKLPTQSGNATWRDIKVYRDHAFVVADVAGHGMQVFDLRRLRGLAPNALRDFTPDAVYSRFGNSHNIAINEATGFAYAVGFGQPGAGLPTSCNAPGVHAVNIQNPTAPVFATCFSDAAVETGPRTPGYTHDVQCVVYSGPDADYAGREVCFAANEDVVSVFDVTDKAAVRLVSKVGYPNFSYTHQGWLTGDQRYFLANDELDEQNGLTPSQRTLVFDLRDLDAPDFAFTYQSGLSAIDHNLYTRGRYAFESNYESGLRILDIASIASGQITETAFFDTYPQGQTVQFNGQWSNYPYFASGNVIASDINNGLFVLRPTTLVVAESETPEADGGYTLSMPAPNPAATATRLTLSVGTAQRVTAAVYDVTGREVATAFAGTASGETIIDVPTAALSPGVYVVRVTGETFTAARRLVVAR